MAKRSAGVLLYRKGRKGLEVLLAHPGGPFWAKKDEGAWTIPKGEYEEGEDALAAAKRELLEETGIEVSGKFLELGAFKQPSGKVVTAFAIEGDFDPAHLKSNAFSMEWPPKSGRIHYFPEVDQAGWFSLEEAKVKMRSEQVPILQALAKKLAVPIPSSSLRGEEKALTRRRRPPRRNG